MAAVIQRGCRPRPAQVSDGLLGFRYFGATFLPLSAVRRGRKEIWSRSVNLTLCRRANRDSNSRRSALTRLTNVSLMRSRNNKRSSTDIAFRLIPFISSHLFGCSYDSHSFARFCTKAICKKTRVSSDRQLKAEYFLHLQFRRQNIL